MHSALCSTRFWCNLLENVENKLLPIPSHMGNHFDEPNNAQFGRSAGWVCENETSAEMPSRNLKNKISVCSHCNYFQLDRANGESGARPRCLLVKCAIRAHRRRCLLNLMCAHTVAFGLINCEARRFAALQRAPEPIHISEIIANRLDDKHIECQFVFFFLSFYWYPCLSTNAACMNRHVF